MLCVNNYTQQYIDECRTRVAEQLSAYQTLVAAARNHPATDEPLLNAAIEAFEPHFFNNMVLALALKRFTESAPKVNHGLPT